MNHHSIARRRLLLGLVAAGVVPWQQLFAQDGLLPATPSDVEGPFFPVNLPSDRDNDLLNVTGNNESAAGRQAHVFGQVMDRSGERIQGARVEIWQSDSQGVYHHPDAPGTPDPNFQGYGRVSTDREGSYHFRTLRPVPYGDRTPHIHFRVTAEGHEQLTTQLYVAQESDRNSSDGLYNNHSAEEQALITASFNPITGDADGPVAAEFNIVLG